VETLGGHYIGDVVIDGMDSPEGFGRYFAVSDQEILLGIGVHATRDQQRTFVQWPNIAVYSQLQNGTILQTRNGSPTPVRVPEPIDGLGIWTFETVLDIETLLARHRDFVREESELIGVPLGVIPSERFVDTLNRVMELSDLSVKNVVRQGWNPIHACRFFFARQNRPIGL
jgi:hypothetical protein